MLLKTIRKFLKKFHLFGCHRKKNDEFLANQSTGPWLRPHRDEPWWQKVTMSSLNSNWVNISYWQQQQCCGYIFTEPTVTPRQETPSSTRRTGKIWFGQECLETRERENCFYWPGMSGKWVCGYDTYGRLWLFLEQEMWSTLCLAVVQQDVTNVLSLRPVSSWGDVNWHRDIYSSVAQILWAVHRHGGESGDDGLVSSIRSSE